MALSDKSQSNSLHLTGVNDPFEPPVNPDLIIRTDEETVKESTDKLAGFILDHVISK